LACDLRIAGEQAAFSESFIKVGLHPDWGGTWFLPRLVGTGRALEMMLTGKRVEADEALEIGLVQQVVPTPHLREQTGRLARRLAKAPTTAARLIKLAVYNSLSYDLEGMLDYETEAQQQCWDSPESTEGIQAFSQKRRPIFERDLHGGEASG
jgi:2-(1,2-epoxy-1,2-dihydrophenyl)acetyl-CoA isomerase